MQVRLHLHLIRVLAVMVDALDELVVGVASTRSWSRCPWCGLRCRAMHDTRGGAFVTPRSCPCRPWPVATACRGRWSLELVGDWATLVAAHRRSQRYRMLLVDETSMRRRHRYVTVLQNGESGEVLAMVAQVKVRHEAPRNRVVARTHLRAVPAVR
jgi:hypothetical protein